jgi:hypothetical protein
VGRVTDEDLEEYVRTYLAEGGLGHFDEVFDLSNADLLDLTYVGLSRVAEAAAATDPGSSPTRIALLVCEPLGVGLSRIYQSLRETKGGTRTARVFFRASDVLDWLGLPLDWTPPPA